MKTENIVSFGDVKQGDIIIVKQTAWKNEYLPYHYATVTTVSNRTFDVKTTKFTCSLKKHDGRGFPSNYDSNNFRGYILTPEREEESQLANDSWWGDTERRELHLAFHRMEWSDLDLDTLRKVKKALEERVVY